MYCCLQWIYTRCDWLKWMEHRETPRMHKYGESKTTRIMMATVLHVTAWAGRTKYQADGFLFDWVYVTWLPVRDLENFRPMDFVRLSVIALAWILYPLHFSPLPLIQEYLNILHQFCFNSCKPRLSFAKIWIFSLIFSQVLFMSSSSFEVSKAANLFVISFAFAYVSLSFLLHRNTWLGIGGRNLIGR